MEKITRAQIDALIKNGSLLTATQQRISLPIVNRMYIKMKNDIRFADIMVTDGMICNGHHRYIAARLAGIDIGICPGKVSAPVLTEWESVMIDEEDWDTPEDIQRHNHADALYSGKSPESIHQLLNIP